MYNATVYQIYPDGSRGTFVAEVEEISGKPQMLRSNWRQFTGYEGKIGRLKETGEEVAVYDLYLRMSAPDCQFQIVMDNCDGYRNAIRGTNLPPAYKAA